MCIWKRGRENVIYDGVDQKSAILLLDSFGLCNFLDVTDLGLKFLLFVPEDICAVCAIS